MSVIEYYILFCLTTSIFSVLELYWPAVIRAKAANIKNEITESPVLSTFIFFIINCLFAPIILPVVIIPGLYERAAVGLDKAIQAPAQEI